MEPKCIKEIQDLQSESEDDDEDFISFHCIVCHDISMGKTNFHCDECGHWVCQSCSIALDGTDNGTVCPDCYKKPKFLYLHKKRKHKKIANLSTKTRS